MVVRASVYEMICIRNAKRPSALCYLMLYYVICVLIWNLYTLHSINRLYYTTDYIHYTVLSFGYVDICFINLSKT